MASEFSTGKSVFVLAIVTGCFAILWPNVFYPMLQGSYPSKNTATTTQGACCDVLFDNDVEAIKVMTDLCESILQNNRNNDSKLHLTAYTGQMNAIIAEACRDAIWNKCHINITEILLSKTGLNRSYKQFVDELRSLNSSICLKQSFGISFVPIGLPRTIRTWNINRPKHLRQERPPHLRPEFLHPALREKGRAIPHSHIVPKVDGRQNGPVPGMRPPMGGAGHVVAGPKGSGTMGIVMPMYTVGIVVFFLYTIMKLLFKKSDTSNNYEQFSSDPDFHRTVFGDYNYSSNEDSIDDATKLVVSAISGLVQEVNEQIRSHQQHSAANENEPEATSNETNEMKNEESEIEEITDKSGMVKVLGYEMTECSSAGGKYSRPSTPSSRPATPASRPVTPHSLYLSNPVPAQSQLLVSQEETQTLPSDDNEQPVVLSAKVTLSLIGLPQEDEQMDLNDKCSVKMSKNDNRKENEVRSVNKDIISADELTKNEDKVNEEDIIDCLSKTQLTKESINIKTSDI